MNHTIKLIAQTITALILSSVFALTAYGQQSGRNPGLAERERQRDMMIREQLEQERELMLRMTERMREAAPRREPRLAFAQIREDYVRLQVVNNELAERVAAKSGTLDLKVVARSTSEIKKRADRLKDNLMLPVPESNDARPKTTVGTEPEQLKSALGTLDQMILRMVRNPLFRNPRLVDASQAAQVRRELEEIVELSGQLKKRSEQLSKAAQKSQ